MSLEFEVLDGGRGNSLQDGGRPGWRHVGIPAGGALDPLLLACANALVGNPEGTEALEIRVVGLRWRASRGHGRVAVAGDVGGRVVRRSGAVERLFQWRAVGLEAGDVLEVAAPRRGLAYLAVGGGYEAAPRLGSRGAYVAAGIGGLAGHLARGSRLVAGARRLGPTRLGVQRVPFSREWSRLRVILGPQDDHFTSRGLESLLSGEFRVGVAVDRMGARLEGPAIEHRDAQSADIVSDAVAPGAIQVPADGRPIVLLADCQTVGGYAKIATVIRADLYRFAHAMPGDPVRFAVATAAEANTAWRAEYAAARAWISGIRDQAAGVRVDPETLLSVDLTDGVVAEGRVAAERTR
jgi:5-oxoprolinase (ATP-hydrolysing) subunit C